MLIIEFAMKKIIGISLFVTVCLSACNKVLDQKPISDGSTDNFYKQPSDFVQAANATYASLKTYPDRQLNLSETRSDNLYAVSDGGVRDWEGINSFHKTIASNPYVGEAWLTDYNGIYRANVVLSNLRRNGNIVPDPALRLRLEAEAKFLRGFYYFDLVRYYGKVPIIDSPVVAAQALNVGQSAVKDVYDFILSDLQFAAT